MDKTTCPWHNQVVMEEDKTSGFAKYFRRYFTVKRCSVCGYMALFSKQKIVQVGKRQTAVSVSFG